MTCGAAFVTLGDSLSQHLTWQNCASGLGTAQTLSLGGSSLGRLGAPKPPSPPLAGWLASQGPPQCLPGTPHTAGVQSVVGMEGDISLALGQMLL